MSIHTVKVTKTLSSQDDYKDWKAEIIQLAEDAPILLEHGMVHQFCTAAHFLTLANVIAPINIRRPAPLAEDASRILQGLYAEHLALYTQHQQLTKIYHLALITSLSPTLRKGIANPDNPDSITMTSQQIMARMAELFGTHTFASIAELKQQLKTPLLASDIGKFTDHSANFTSNCYELRRSGNTVNNVDQIVLFRETLVGQQAAHEAAERFSQLHPEVAGATLAPLIIYISNQLKNPSVQAFGYANAATAQTIPPGLEATIGAIVAAAVAQEFKKQAGGAAPRRAAGGAAGGNTPARHKSRLYCYHHGYIGHAGVNCKHMLADTKTFSPAMLNSPNPGHMPGGHQ